MSRKREKLCLSQGSQSAPCVTVDLFLVHDSEVVYHTHTLIDCNTVETLFAYARLTLMKLVGSHLRSFSLHCNSLSQKCDNKLLLVQFNLWQQISSEFAVEISRNSKS